MDTALDTAVREALLKRKGDWQSIASAADVSHSWLSKFVNGHIDNPGFATLKRLHTYLATEPTPATPTDAKAAA